MQNPKTMAIVSAVAAVLLGFMIFGRTETPSGALSAIQWGLFILALVGLVGSLYQMSQK